MKNTHKKFNDTKTSQQINKNIRKEMSDSSLADTTAEYGENKQNITLKTHKESKKSAKR